MFLTEIFLFRSRPFSLYLQTIAFLLPMFRHIKAQRPIESLEGPIALIMTPTRELAVQIHKECKHFNKALGLRAVCCYGGSPIKDQIAELKRGAEIIICTPGRMIDLLCANSGRVTNLKRVTYLVLDEADRMFDMGFEPQVMKMVNNVRPARQTILFSATFPRKMEALARKILHKPLEITVGGRSVVCDDVEQVVEVREEDTKFLRLLEILGRSSTLDPDAKILIFVDRQEAADNLLANLLRRGYPCQSLHGGKDQADRDQTIADYKTGDTNILIATSVAARGLDVKQLKIVINYECPNHMEDYVHRVGRTGRAGQKGTAYTFITPEQDRFAGDIVKALTLSLKPIPEDLKNLEESFLLKVKKGTAHFSSSGFGGKGLEKLDKDRDTVKKIQKKSHGAEYADEDEEDDDEADAKFEAKEAGGAAALPSDDKKPASEAAFAYEIEINDYPQKARWRVTNKEQIMQITEISGAAITTRGTYFPPGKPLGPGDRKLYLVSGFLCNI
ncbi:P-loop containing nucleoside triphosphate hydrolase protein [Blyttiomyces helicus]|uniref:RNA helicase n=1 Tax=Blyttiomyces helicus TaxID=388810 RepID=A0A4P9VWW2_9FUNG|nr:P-loop containing nucleoside triphosphate hydrolase protein [Blyttiomyces helicus]|eukprot:RKO84209.1 P-loop containing nucleoside triphosphate hydrolase protein [Blyttiomyces helicus]